MYQDFAVRFFLAILLLTLFVTVTDLKFKSVENIAIVAAVIAWG